MRYVPLVSESELKRRCEAALAIAREQGYSLALIGYLEILGERVSALEDEAERRAFSPEEAPTPRRPPSETFRRVSQELQAARVRSGLEEMKETREMTLDDVVPPRKITKPGL